MCHRTDTDRRREDAARPHACAVRGGRAVLSGLGLYERLIDFAGAGALVPVSGFGHSIARGALLEAERIGFLGLFTGAFEFTGMGVAVAVILATVIALVANPRPDAPDAPDTADARDAGP